LRAANSRVEHTAHGVLGTINVRSRTGKQQPVAVCANAHSQTLFERREILIELSKETDAIGQIA
jgi:hypothetical protein